MGVITLVLHLDEDETLGLIDEANRKHARAAGGFEKVSPLEDLALRVLQQVVQDSPKMALASWNSSGKTKGK